MNRQHIAVVGLALAVAGCARMEAITEIQPDGSWKRTVSMELGQEPMGKPKKLSDVFGVPSKGWKVEQSTEDDTLKLRATKLFKLGEQLSVARVHLSEGAKLKTTCTVKKLGDGKYEYREEIRWVGTKKRETLADDEGKVREKLEKLFPKGLAKDADYKAIGLAMNKKIIRILYGPKDPLLASFVLHPSYTIRRLKHRMGSALDKVLQKHFGGRLPTAKRHAVVRSMMDDVEKDMEKKKEKSKENAKPGPPGKKKKDSQPVPLSFVLRAPKGGKIVESNGTHNELAGEVYWALYPEAAVAEPVVLKAVVEVGN